VACRHNHFGTLDAFMKRGVHPIGLVRLPPTGSRFWVAFAQNMDFGKLQQLSAAEDPA